MEDLSSEQNNVLNTIAHELKNPLIIINAHADLVSGQDPETQKHLDSIKMVSARLMQTIDTLLLSGKIEAGQTDLEIEHFDIREQIRLVSKELQTQLESRNQRFVFRSPQRVPRVYGNQTYAYLALYNLIENASKYSPERSEINISIRTAPNSLKILVRDHGIGINKADVGRLFTQFGKLKSPLHQRPSSTGLGLYISKRLVSSMGGNLSHTTVNQGSCFVLALPTTEQLRLF